MLVEVKHMNFKYTSNSELTAGSKVYKSSMMKYSLSISGVSGYYGYNYKSAKTANVSEIMKVLSGTAIVHHNNVYLLVDQSL